MALLWQGPSHSRILGDTAMTVAERIASVNAVPSVLEAYASKAPAAITGTGSLWHARISWYYLDGGIVKDGGGDLIIADFGVEGQEAAYWHGSTPSILVPVVAPTYITGRTAAAAAEPKRPFTKAEVESFCNTQWRATSGNAQARAIIDFSAENTTPNTILVRGRFHDVATNSWPRLSYFITLVDPNGSASGANVKFEKVID